jgi:hypothetical protein
MQQPVDRQGALLRMAQGFLSPTKTGGFAENLGLAVGNYADANDKFKEQEMDRTMKLAQIEAARAKLRMEGAGQDFDLYQKGYGLVQDQRRQQAWDGLSVPPASLDNVVEQMNQTGMALPSGGLDASGFAPGFNNAPINAPVRRVTPQRPMPDEAAGEQRQMEDMMRLRALEEEAAGADLPPAPNRVGAQGVPAPMPDMTETIPNTPAEFMSQPSAPMSAANDPAMFSRKMAITPEQMQRFQRPQPQQAAPQQPQQPMPRPNSPEGIALSEAGRMIELLHSPRGREIRKIDPEGWQAREKAAVETLSKFATPDTRNFTAAQSDPAFLDFLRQQAEAKATRVDARNMGNIPPGMQIVTDPQSGAIRMEEIPGGPVERERIANEESRGRMETLTARQLNPTIDDITTARDLASNKALGFVPTTGMFSNIVKMVPFAGQTAIDLGATIDAIGSGVSLENLNQMRQASPTGGALGNVSDKQSALLSEAFGSLRQSTSEELFLYNLARVENSLNDIVHGEGNGPPRHDMQSLRARLRGQSGGPQPGSAPPPAGDVDDILKRFKVLQ